MPKITPFLWFDDNAEEAMNYYVSIFKNSKALNVSRNPETGQAFVVNFQLDGQEITALNGGPEFAFTEAFSFFVNCAGQEEVDYFWNKLTADGGEAGNCGWLKDKFGLSWQIIPSALGELMGDKDATKAQRVMQAMLQMRKIDVKGLRQAYDSA